MPTSSSSSASISAVSAARNRVGLLALPPKTDVTGGTTTPEFDLVAVHGLNGGRWSTWTRTEDKKETMWLQDLLPMKLPKARVMTFGYNANIVNNFSSFGVREHARTLLTRLKTKRDKLNGRPIVFVCHSLGGIVVKQALRLANNEKAFDDIAQSTRGILFFGTPHRGADLAFWGDIVAKIAKTVFLNPKRELIKDLKTNSPTLVQVSEDFRPIADKYKIVSFFEEDGILGTSNVVVPRSSALLEIPNEIPVPFEGNHMDICRFGADDEDRFDEVWIAIRDIVGESTQDKLSREELNFLKSFSTFYPDHLFDEAIQQPLPGTCEWINRTESYADWCSTDGPAILHIYGKPGSGKSTMSRFLYEQVQSFTAWDVKVYFSFSQQDQGRRSAHKAYGSLIEQLLAQQPALMRKMLQKGKVYTRGQRATRSETNLRQYLSELTQCADCGKTLIILDTLDECHSSEPKLLKDFLERIIQIASDSRKVKVIILSRPNAIVSSAISDAFKVNLDVEPAVDRDIRTVIKAKVADLMIQRPGLEDVKDQIEESLLQRAGGMFLLVQLVLTELEELNETTERNIQLVLQSLPRTVTEAYQRILEGVPERDQKWARRALNWILYATRPLTILELKHAVGLTDEVTSLRDISRNVHLDFERDLRRTFGALLSPGIEKIQLVHQTAKETLLHLDANKNKWFVISREEGEEFLLSACHKYVSMSQRFLAPREMQLPLTATNDAPILEYAIENIPEHARHLPSPKQNYHRIFVQFLESSLFHSWEACYWYLRDPSRKNTGSPIHLACMLGLKFAAQDIINRHPNLVNSRDHNLRTVLDVAVEAGINETVGLLLEHRVDIEAQGKDYTTAIVTAAWFGRVEIVKSLIRAGAKCRNRALEAAAEAGHEAVMDILLPKEDFDNYSRLESWELVHDVHVPESIRIALFSAASSGQVKSIKYLLSRNIKPTTACSKDGNVLHVASRFGRLATARSVLENGCGPHDRNENGQTPLHLAALSGHESIYRLLVESHADVNASDHDGNTVFHFAARGHNGGSVNMLRVQAVLQLLDKGANPRLTDMHGRTPLHEFSRSDDVSQYGLFGLRDQTPRVPKQLLARGASLDDRDNDNSTPLQLAIRNEHLYKSVSLLQCGAQLISAMDSGKNAWLLRNLVCDAYLAGQLGVFRHVVSVYEITSPYRWGWLQRAWKDREGELWSEIAQLTPKAELERVTLFFLSGIEFKSSDPDGEIAFLLEHSQLSSHQLDAIGAVKNGQTVLSNAAEQGRKADVQMLLQCGVSKEVPDTKGCTALWFAVREGKVDCATLLLESGADPRVRECDGDDVLQTAERYHNDKTDLVFLIKRKVSGY